MSEVSLVSHPLLQHKLSLLRDKHTPTPEFRRLLREMGMLFAYEVTRDLPLDSRTIETPLASTEAPSVDFTRLCVVSILRAGNGLLEGMLDLIPTAPVGHIGLYRDHDTLAAVHYYFKVPPDLERRLCIVVDPMLATGNSAVAALGRLKQAGARTIRYVCVLAAPEGLKAVRNAHPDVRIYTAAIDSHLNEHGYIVPGLGDAGDRLYGTR
jgi:uracil phosphoribosyltransferase